MRAMSGCVVSDRRLAPCRSRVCWSIVSRRSACRRASAVVIESPRCESDFGREASSREGEASAEPDTEDDNGFGMVWPGRGLWLNDSGRPSTTTRRISERDSSFHHRWPFNRGSCSVETWRSGPAQK